MSKNVGTINLIFGPSSVGKDTIANILRDRGMNFIYSITSRPMRENESQRNPYFFVSQDEFLKEIEDGNLIEYREYNTLVDGIPDTWYYGVSKDGVKDEIAHHVCVLDIHGIREFIKYFSESKINIFNITANDSIRLERAKARGSFNEQEWQRRLADDTAKFINIDFEKELQYCVKNYKIHNIVNEGELSDALDEIYQLVAEDDSEETEDFIRNWNSNLINR
jgi:guanylate kinase